MDYSDLQEKLRELKTEDFIWVIYIGIIVLSWISNSFERDYFVNDNIKSRDTYRNILIIIFAILIIVYIYFFKESINDIRNLKPSDSEQKKVFVYLSALGSFLILVSGIIFLFIAIADENIDVELAFN